MLFQEFEEVVERLHDSVGANVKLCEPHLKANVLEALNCSPGAAAHSEQINNILLADPGTNQLTILYPKSPEWQPNRLTTLSFAKSASMGQRRINDAWISCVALHVSLHAVIHDLYISRCVSMVKFTFQA